jgi:hypothetical protein
MSETPSGPYVDRGGDLDLDVVPRVGHRGDLGDGMVGAVEAGKRDHQILTRNNGDGRCVLLLSEGLLDDAFQCVQHRVGLFLRHIQRRHETQHVRPRSIQ